MGLHTIDKGQCFVHLQRILGKSREKEFQARAGRPNGQWRRILREIRGILLMSRYPTGVHYVEDVGAKWYGQNNEPNCDGESLMHATTPQVTKDLLG